MTYKRVRKLEAIARLTLDPSGFTNEQIANMLNCHKQTIVMIRQLPEFHAKIMELSSGVLSQYDAQLRENVDNMRQEIRSMVPSALNAIKSAVLGLSGPNLQFKAAQEILDREGNLAKVSKTSVSFEKTPNMQVDPTVASNLMALLASAPPISTLECEVTPNAFTQSGGIAESRAFDLSQVDANALLDAVAVDKSNMN